MKKLVNLGVFVALAMLAMTSCTNDQSERIAALEKKIEELESADTEAVTKQKPTSLAANVESNTRPEGPLPAFEFESEEFDFGTIDAGTIIEHTFRFKNVGEAPLVIQSATASCGCTVPKKPSEPIPVGEYGEIGVKYNSTNKNGVQSPIITIRANTFPNVKKVKLKGTVNPKADASQGPLRK